MAYRLLRLKLTEEQASKLDALQKVSGINEDIVSSLMGLFSLKGLNLEEVETNAQMAKRLLASGDEAGAAQALLADLKAKEAKVAGKPAGKKEGLQTSRESRRGGRSCAGPAACRRGTATSPTPARRW